MCSVWRACLACHTGALDMECNSVLDHSMDGPQWPSGPRGSKASVQLLREVPAQSDHLPTEDKGASGLSFPKLKGENRWEPGARLRHSTPTPLQVSHRPEAGLALPQPGWRSLSPAGDLLNDQENYHCHLRSQTQGPSRATETDVSSESWGDVVDLFPGCLH